MAMSAAGVTINVSTVAKPRPKTIAVDRLIHHCVDGAPTVISRDRNSMFMPNAIGSHGSIFYKALPVHGNEEAMDIVIVT